MIFQSRAAQTVFDRYEARAEVDRVRMRELGPAGMASRDEFLLPVGAEVGALLHALIVARRPRHIVEIGTSYGYSTLFLADAARLTGAKLTTMELADYKQAHAREQLEEAGLADGVEFMCGDAVAMLRDGKDPIDFALMDLWKDLYIPCLEQLYPRLSEEGVIATDNMIQPEFDRPIMREYRAALDARGDLQTTLLPVGSGLGLSVRWSAGNPKL